MTQIIIKVFHMYLLTKSRIMTGLTCPKKLWFDTHDKLKTDSFLFHLGNRFGDYSRSHYGSGIDLTHNLNIQDALDKTSVAIADKNVKVIYEGAFLYSDTLVRADVLVRNGNSWEMVEVKSSSDLKEDHIKDASIQAYILRSCGISLSSIKIAHINKDFVYKGNNDYQGFLVEHDITTQAQDNQVNVEQWINQLKDYARPEAPQPQMDMGEHCSKPYKCLYIGRCESEIPKLAQVPVSIFPRASKVFIQKWADLGIHDLREIPPSELDKPLYKIIQQAHISNSKWVDENLQSEIRSLGWPRFFMDFETVQQGVPLIPNTKPRDAVPFQWSIHRWASPTQQVSINDGAGFLDFTGPNIDRKFLETLIATLGESGPIFAHHAETECGVLKYLVARENCKDLTPEIEKIISRVIDTLRIVRDGFYDPKLNGSYSLKEIVKAIPTSVSYTEEGALSGGDEAQISWFLATDPNITENKAAELRKKLKEYCAKDTYALYDLVKYLGGY